MSWLICSILHDLLHEIADHRHSCISFSKILLLGNISTRTDRSFVSAIACHKFIIAFCVCLDMVQAGTRKSIFFSYLSIFSLVSAVGIAIGLIITEAGAGSVPEIVVATLQGLTCHLTGKIFTSSWKCFAGIAAGTLLYVVMFEVLNRERQKQLSGLLQLIAVLLGFIIMIVIQIFSEQILNYQW